MPEVTDELIDEVMTTHKSNMLTYRLALEVRSGREERTALADTIRRLRDGMETALREMVQASHYAHHDPLGTYGANCPACQAMTRAKEALRG